MPHSSRIHLDYSISYAIYLFKRIFLRISSFLRKKPGKVQILESFLKQRKQRKGTKQMKLYLYLYLFLFLYLYLSLSLSGRV